MRSPKHRPRGTYLAVVFVAFFVLCPWAWAAHKEKVLYSFQGGTDGATPAGGVAFDATGNLYGATTNGGSTSCRSIAQCGTVFQLARPAKQGDPWIETVLYVFKGNASNDGTSPAGGVVIDKAGNLYGTTAYGGTGNCVLLGSKLGCGTVYELSPPKQKGGAWTETVLYSFPTAKQGYLPNGDLVFDGAGNLYGATMFGGGHGTTCDTLYQYCGAVFELSPPKTKGGKWTEKVLHGFKSGKDGANPNGGLIFDAKGAIYGTTQTGGFDGGFCGSGGCGIVFKLVPPTMKGNVWTEQVLDRFTLANSGGAEPQAGLILDRIGNLLGTTVGGGISGSGTIFQLTHCPNGKWMEHVLYRFLDRNDGSEPRGSLLFDHKGDLYGTASGGGMAGNGTLFRLRPSGKSWIFMQAYEYKASPDGAYPTGKLTLDRIGNLYGTTQYGGSGQACGNFRCGIVFEISP